MSKHFLLRNIHRSKKQIEKFEKVYLLPIHYKISSKELNFTSTYYKMSLDLIN